MVSDCHNPIKDFSCRTYRRLGLRPQPVYPCALFLCSCRRWWRWCSLRAVVIGCLLGAAAGVLYVLADALSARPQGALTALLAGRALMGCAESLIVTGALSWGVGRVGPQNAGRVMAWVGVAIYAAYALGAPAGMRLYAYAGFAGLAWATVVIPLAALALVLSQRAAPAVGGVRTPFYRVLGMVLLPGLALALRRPVRP